MRRSRNQRFVCGICTASTTENAKRLTRLRRTINRNRSPDEPASSTAASAWPRLARSSGVTGLPPRGDLGSASNRAISGSGSKTVTNELPSASTGVGPAFRLTRERCYSASPAAPTATGDGVHDKFVARAGGGWFFGANLTWLSVGRQRRFIHARQQSRYPPRSARRDPSGTRPNRRPAPGAAVFPFSQVREGKLSVRSRGRSRAWSLVVPSAADREFLPPAIHSHPCPRGDATADCRMPPPARAHEGAG